MAPLLKGKLVASKVHDSAESIKPRFDLTNSWTAPVTAKAGALVHEHRHSDADTGDVTYGQANARALAISTPAQAVKSADNYAYYAGG